MTWSPLVGDTGAALRELNQALNLTASEADLRNQFLGYLANDAIDSVTPQQLPSAWAKCGTSSLCSFTVSLRV